MDKRSFYVIIIKTEVGAGVQIRPCLQRFKLIKCENWFFLYRL